MDALAPDSPCLPDPDGRQLVLRTIAAHAPSLLGTARRYSLCRDDAEDAYQRALEIFLRRAASVDPEHAVGWLRTVVKHEALAVRASRLRLVGPGEVDLDREEAAHLEGAEERAAEREHAERGAEALGRLKPQEIRALVLKARGYSYREIAEICGWTYTKVNRCITEGRRAFLDRYHEIASGRECRRWTPVLSALADGEASAADVAAVRPHLRACPACRAALRDFRLAPGAVAPFAPVAAAAGPPGGLLARAWEALTGGGHVLHDRAVLAAQKLQAGAEAASTGKLAAVAASATALAGGGVAAVAQGRRAAPARVAKAIPRARHQPPAAPPAATPAPAVRTATAAPPPAATAPDPTPSRRATLTRSAPSEFAPEGGGSAEPSPAPTAGPGVATATDAGVSSSSSPRTAPSRSPAGSTSSSAPSSSSEFSP
jgi:RNA polymerase sigma factor (sigma-70 family)